MEEKSTKKAVDFETLKAELKALQLRQNKEVWPFSLMKRGIPKGALIEVSSPIGGGKTEFILKFISENPSLKGAWIEKDFNFYPCILNQYKIEFHRILFVDSSESLWAAYQSLKSQAFEVLVLGGLSIEQTALRRLQIAAEKSKTTVFILSLQPTQQGRWPFAHQIEVRREKNLLKVNLFK